MKISIHGLDVYIQRQDTPLSTWYSLEFEDDEGRTWSTLSPYNTYGAAKLMLDQVLYDQFIYDDEWTIYTPHDSLAWVVDERESELEV